MGGPLVVWLSLWAALVVSEYLSKTLHGRAEAITSSVVHKDDEVRHVRQALGVNGYPRGVVERYSDTTRAAHRDSQTTRGKGRTWFTRSPVPTVQPLT